MPKSSSFKRGGSKYGTGSKYKRSKPVAKKVATKSYVKTMINKDIEKKYRETKEWEVSISTSGAISGSLVQTTQGTSDYNERVGDEITLTSIDFRGILVRKDTTNIVRLIFIQWKPNATLVAPTLATVLAVGPSTSIDYLSPFIFDYETQFSILHDKLYVLNDDVTVIPLHLRLPIKRKKLTYTAGTSSSNNAIYYLAISDSGVANHPQMSYTLRVLYQDC